MGIFGNAFTGWHALIILVVVVLLFGAAKLPALAKSVGQSMKIFKSEVKGDRGEERVDAEATPVVPRAADPVPPRAADADPKS